MAKKTPKKFRQARKDAKTEAKKAFSGKKKAVLKDPSVKYSADDQKILKEVAQEAKRGYITTDTGERVYSKPTETARERIARERAEAMRKYREQIEAEDGKKPAKKKPAAKKVFEPRSTKPSAKEKPMPKKPGKNYAKYGALDEYKIEKNLEKESKVKKPGVKKPTRAEKSAANKAAWKNMTPEQRKNWKANKPSVIKTDKAATSRQVNPIGKNALKKYGSSGGNQTILRVERSQAAEIDKKAKISKGSKGAAKTAAKSPVYSITDVQPEKASKGAKKAKFVQKKTGATVAKTTTAAPKTGGTVAVRPKGTVATTSKTGKAVATTGKSTTAAAAAAKKAKFGKLKKFARGAALFAVGAEAVSLAKGSVTKDQKELDRLEKKLAALKGKKAPSGFELYRKGMGANISTLADLATMGGVGKTRRERMDELNKLIQKQQKKNAAAAGPKPGKVDYSVRGRGPGGPGSPAAKAAAASAASSSSGASGGTKPSTTPGGTYVVKRGDTLSGIAKSAGVSLAEIRAANKKFAKNPKYKQGSMIWAGTTVKIPKKKQVNKCR